MNSIGRRHRIRVTVDAKGVARDILSIAIQPILEIQLRLADRAQAGDGGFTRRFRRPTRDIP
jgi:hypothetical protein